MFSPVLLVCLFVANLRVWLLVSVQSIAPKRLLRNDPIYVERDVRLGSVIATNVETLNTTFKTHDISARSLISFVRGRQQCVH